MKKLTTLNRYELIGNYNFIGKGLIKDHETGNTFEAELKFTSTTPAIQTEKIDGENHAKLNVDIVKNPYELSLWEIVIHDEK